MKEFNLEEAKAGKSVCTRDGRPARIICFDAKGKYPIIALVSEISGDEYCYAYTKNGAYSCSADVYDLMMAIEKHEGFINIYKHENTRDVGALYDTMEQAKQGKDKTNYITTIKIEWEE